MFNLRSGLLGVALSSALCLASANAADVYYSGGLKDTGYAAIWNGPYFGVHGGGAWSSVDVADVDGFVAHNTFSNNGSGAFGGGTIGWNWQFGHIVYSFEMDLGVMDVSHTSADPLDHTVTAHMDTGVYGDIDGRVGYALDRTLVYAKGGFGFFNGAGTVKSSIDETYKTQSFYGWNIGAGLEYKITPNWSVKAEYLHFDLGNDQEHFMNGGAPGGARWTNTVSLDTVKAGVNYEILDVRAPLK